jgi:hypothetical protein
VSGSVDGDSPEGGGVADNGAGQASSTGANSSNGGSSSGNGQAGNGTSAGSTSATAGNGTVPSGGKGSAGSSAGAAGNGTTAGAGGDSTVTPHDCKRGVAWAGNKLDNAEVNSQLTWWYKWGLSAQGVGAGLEFVPMISGGGSKVADDNKAIRPDAKYLLGYNEPNFTSQANLTPQQAAADWPTLEAVAKAHNLKLVSPAVNYCGDDKTGTGPCNGTNPATYLQDFFAACSNCQVDYVAVHWYNCDGASLKSYLDLFKQFGRPIWLTEFACAYGGDTSVAGQEKYMREAIPILEARSDVFRYSWFSADPIPNARLLNADGSPTDLGKVYLSLPRDPTCTP